MSTSWVAGAVRAKALARRRLGVEGARALALSPSLAEAVETLAQTPYGRDVRVTHTLPEAQHAVGATLLWHLRVLSGWLPRGGPDALRLLAAGFEVANVDEQVRALRGRPVDPDYRLGMLETAWSRLRQATSLPALQQELGTSAWGDPGAATPWAIHVGLRLAWADRVIAGVPQAAGWARAAAALLLLRESQLGGRRLGDPLALRATYVLGPSFVTELSRGPAGVGRLAPLLPSDARWVLRGVEREQDLWRAEVAWWQRVEQDGFALLRGAAFERDPVVGAAAVLAVDAWRVRAALEAAARAPRGGPAVLEAFDAVA